MILKAHYAHLSDKMIRSLVKEATDDKRGCLRADAPSDCVAACLMNRSRTWPIAIRRAFLIDSTAGEGGISILIV